MDVLSPSFEGEGGSDLPAINAEDPPEVPQEETFGGASQAATEVDAYGESDPGLSLKKIEKSNGKSKKKASSAGSRLTLGQGARRESVALGGAGESAAADAPKVDFGFLGSLANMPPPPGFQYNSQEDIKVDDLLQDTDKLLMGLSLPAKSEDGVNQSKMTLSNPAERSVTAKSRLVQSGVRDFVIRSFFFFLNDD
jgi:hypothetical protein